MSKYADIEQIKKTIREEWVKYIPMDLDMHISFVLGKIAEVPTIEVSDGEWVKDEYDIARCSECNCINNTFYRNYCPNCGARMR